MNKGTQKRKAAGRKLIIVLLSFMMLFINIAPAQAQELNEIQQNAIAMLNYITVLSQEIISSTNSRLYLEEAYSSLVNNVYPNSVDEGTLSQLMAMLDVLEECRMLNVQRDRIQFLYEQEKADAIYSALPEPIDFMSFVHATKNPEQLLSIANMVISSVANYKQAQGAAEMNMIQEGWKLDDEEAALIHTSRSNIFAYMVSIVNQYNIPGYMTLTEKAVQDFTEWKNNDNTIAKIQFFESNADTYKTFGGYWLALAQCYYDNGDYRKCIDAVDEYQRLNIQIFRKDYDLANVLPMAIAASQQVGGDETDRVEKYAQIMLDNSDNDNWALRFFAAQTYVNLYDESQNEQYLRQAYQILIDNVNSMVSDQKKLNTDYLSPIQETQVPKDATEQQKDQIRKYNQMLKEKRKTELPEVSEALRLNLDLLFMLADKLSIDNSEALKIDGILHPKGEKLFLNELVDQHYWKIPAGWQAADPMNVEFAGTVIRFPASYVSEDSVIKVSVTEENGEETILTDWTIQEVKRDSDTNIADIHAIFISEDAKKHSWGPNSNIIITVSPKAECDIPDIVSKYTSEEAKKDVFDWLKVWEGHKNEWYDYLKVWENPVNFIYVEPES